MGVFFSIPRHYTPLCNFSSSWQCSLVVHDLNLQCEDLCCIKSGFDYICLGCIFFVLFCFFFFFNVCFLTCVAMNFFKYCIFLFLVVLIIKSGFDHCLSCDFVFAF